MILSMSEQFHLFLFTILIGLGTGLVYDVFRILRKVFRHPNFLIQIEDILFWLIVTFMMFRFMLDKNYGEMRGFLLGGLLLGMISYFFTISQLFINTIMSILHIIERVIKTILKIIFFPVKILLRLLGIPLRFLKPVAIKTGRNSKKILKKTGQCVKMKGRKTVRDIRIIMKKI